MSSSVQCVICDELVADHHVVRVQGEALAILAKAKKRQNWKWSPPHPKHATVHVDCMEIYARCRFLTHLVAGHHDTIKTITRFPTICRGNVGMSDSSQRRSLVFWPTTNSELNEPNRRILRKDSIRTVNALHDSEENLIDKDPEKPYSRLTQFYKMPEKLFKVIIVGDPTVGKTAFVQRYVSNVFKREFKGTVGVDFSLKILNYSESQTVKLQLWDIAGQERFTWMTRVYYKDAHSCIIMFDLSNRSSFHNTLKWKQDVDAKCSLADGSPIPCMLLGNKCDLTTRQIDQMEIETFAKEHNFIGWTEVSAKEGLMVHDSMKFLVDTMLIQEKIEVDGLNGSTEPLKLNKEQKPKSFCSC